LIPDYIVHNGQSHIRTFPHRTFLLFENVWMCDGTFFCSSKMCECAIAHFVALKNCANVQSHFFLLFEKVQKKCDRTIALSKWANVQKCAKKW